MIEHSVVVKIERPCDEVFAFVTDAANHPRWDRSSVSMLPDEQGPWRAGLTFHEVRVSGIEPD